MPYVSRNEQGEINGVFTAKQPGYGEEFLQNDDPAVAAFRTPKVLSDEDHAEMQLTSSPEMHALIKTLAKRFSISQRKLLDEIRAEAKGA
jgi:hypothetical protein